LHRTDLTAQYLIKSLLFVPYANPGHGGELFPILVPGWTLNYEMAFYSLFALTLFAPARWRAWLIGAAISAAAVLGLLYPRERMYSIWGFYTGAIVLLFAAGVLLGAAYVRARDRKLHLHVPKWVCAASIILGFWVILADLPHFPLWQLAGSVVIVGGVVAWEYQYGLPRWRVPLLLGDASYSIYLVHLFAFGLVRTAWNHLHFESASAFAVLAIGSAIALALLTYQLIERPSLGLLMRMTSWRAERQGHPLASA
jgi:exopolysaccharide production protein ExoZ